MRFGTLTLAAVLAAASLSSGAALGQTAPLSQIDVETHVDSGWVTNETAKRRSIFSTVVSEPGRPWLRLRFDEVELGRSPNGGEVTLLRITSLEDGARQHLNAMHLDQWQNTSAYFNGDAVLLEIIADPDAEPSMVRITEFWAGDLAGNTIESICGAVDDRTLSSDDRNGRAVPIGCTAWIIDDANHCFLTAGHCSGGSDVVEFNVPLSNSQGTINHPGPEDQYAADPASVQSNGGQGTGDDWAYFGCFPNTETGLTAFQAQGDSYVLALPPPVSGQNIRITGYGTTTGTQGTPLEWSQVQKTHVGPYVTFSGSLVQYQTDTTGGNSGSPVILEETGDAIGIHTHGGCNSGGGQNSGTGTNHAGLQNALANPQGVCIPDVLRFDYPNGLPDLVDPSGDALRVEITAGESGTPEPGTGRFFYSDSADGFVEGTMIEVTDNVYDAIFPALPCGVSVAFYFSAETTLGEVVNDPINAPADAYSTLAASGTITLIADDFEADTGWTVVDQNLQSGSWTRATPAGNGGSRSDPPSDFDGSGQCQVTGNAFDEDVDGGPTLLTSPLFDLSVTVDPQVSYARWHVTEDGNDFMIVEISNDDGGSWTQVESVGTTVGWNQVQFRVADFVTPTAQMRLRFNVADQPNDSVTEGGVDAFAILDVICDTNTFPPTDFTVEQGLFDSGGLADLGASDDSYLRVLQRAPVTPTLPNVGVAVEANSSILSPSQLDFTMEASASAIPANVPQRLALFNHDTNGYELVDSRIASTSDQSFTVSFTTDPGRFVAGNGDVSARMRWFDPGTVVIIGWGVSIDQAIWEIFE